MKRIINIYNFVRAVEPRIKSITPDILYETTKKQVEQVRRFEFPATFALQYDALIIKRYQNLMKHELPDNCEVAAWWEITQPHVERAGLTWRGRFPWDWQAHVGFSPGYTPAEREKLVDVYMEDFKGIFGYYPQTVGSWFIDAHTLAYLSDKYSIAASCNCKDQVGTDGYTLWGGYWNQAYYPSRSNAYMPAQGGDKQIPVPVFRMLGSDPIYQYDDALGTMKQQVVSLEPVYKDGGGNPEWVKWFFDLTLTAPCLSFAYAQAGQENSFTWDRIGKALEDQYTQLTQLLTDKKVIIETLAESGRWFKKNFTHTPATSVTALDDWKHEGRRTVWFNSRFYRINLLWQNGEFRIRDMHLFDQDYVSDYMDKALKSSTCEYKTLPLMDGFHWSTGHELAGIRFMERGSEANRLLSVYDPVVSELGNGTLSISFIVEKLGEITILCEEATLEIKQTIFRTDSHSSTDSLIDPINGSDLDWALSFDWAPEKTLPITDISKQSVTYCQNSFSYTLSCGKGFFESRVDSESMGFWILPEKGSILLEMHNGKSYL